MGAAQSDEVAESGLELLSGWKILHVAEGSPCDQQGLVAYFDLITHADDILLTAEESSLVSRLKEYVPIKLTILSLSTRISRTLTIIPRRDWGGEGLLGLMIRYQSLDEVELECIHVLDVHYGSPAYMAGLQSYSDYLLGSQRLAFKGWDQLDYWLTQEDKRSTSLTVFNANTWRVREINITPNSQWGGKGSLGADVAQGYIHRLPVFDNIRRPVTMDKRSRVRKGKQKEKGLIYEEGQLMMNLVIGNEGRNDDDDVTLLSIRVREKEEYQPRMRSKITPTEKQRNEHHGQALNHDDHGHAHDTDHGHPHPHSHGHSHDPVHPHGNDHDHGHDRSHSHSHGPPPSQQKNMEQKQQPTPQAANLINNSPPSQIRPATQSAAQSLPPQHAAQQPRHSHGPNQTLDSPTISSTSTATQTSASTLQSQNTYTAPPTTKKPLTAQLPRSRETSPQLIPTATSPPSYPQPFPQLATSSHTQALTQPTAVRNTPYNVGDLT